MKTLVIEDNANIIEAISLIFQLRWPEMEMVSAPLGKEGIEMVETESPDVVLLDINLPDISGFQVLSGIRRFSDVPVIIITVRGEETDKVRGLVLSCINPYTFVLDDRDIPPVWSTRRDVHARCAPE